MRPLVNQSNYSSYFNTSPIANVADHSGHYELIKLLAVVLLTAMIILANSLIITAFVTCRRLQKKSANFLITSQACSDLFTSIVFCPVHLIEKYYMKMGVEAFLIGYMIFLSLFNLLALCVDRFLALSKPFLHHRLNSVRYAVKQILLVWLLPWCITLLPLAWWFSPNSAFISRVYLCVIWILMLFLVVFMTIIYALVTMKAKRLIRNRRLSIISSRSDSSSSMIDAECLTRKELRVVHLFGLLLFLFVATYLPLLYMNFCDIIEQEDIIPQCLEELSFYIILLDSVINPIMSMYLKKDFHNNLKCRFRKKIPLSSRNESIMAETSFIVDSRSEKNNEF